MHEVLSSIRLVKAFGREDHERRRFDDQSAQIVDSILRARDVKAKLSPTVEIIGLAGIKRVRGVEGLCDVNPRAVIAPDRPL
jgi:ABC-type multidrug transport system fused ATPase/permease subunit